MVADANRVQHYKKPTEEVQRNANADTIGFGENSVILFMDTDVDIPVSAYHANRWQWRHTGNSAQTGNWLAQPWNSVEKLLSFYFCWKKWIIFTLWVNWRYEVTVLLSKMKYQSRISFFGQQIYYCLYLKFLSSYTSVSVIHKTFYISTINKNIRKVRK